MTRAGRHLAAVVVGASLLLAGCGGAPADVGAKEVKQLDASAEPGELLGLKVATEDIGGAKHVKDPFVESVGLYSLRQGDQLQGTLQVSTFTKGADSETARFRKAVVQQVGSTVPQQYKMGGHTVYLTAGKRQSIAVWFQGRTFYVLSMREEFEQPRALLRAALEIKP